MDWKEQYKHPNWQRKRLQALEFAEFACEGCGRDAETLHVHHKRYVAGRKVWEYDIRELAVLCDECHAREHAGKDALGDLIAEIGPMYLPMGQLAALAAGYASFANGPGIGISDPLQVIIDEYPEAFAAGRRAAEGERRVRARRIRKALEG